MKQDYLQDDSHKHSSDSNTQWRSFTPPPPPRFSLKHLYLNISLSQQPYPESDTVLPGGVLEPSPGHAVVGAGEPQLYLPPVSSGQKLEPKTVRLRQAPVHPGQPSPGTASGGRGRGRREGAATRSGLVHIRHIWVILQRNWLTAWREPVPLGQHGIARSQVVEPERRKNIHKLSKLELQPELMLHVPPPSACLTV